MYVLSTLCQFSLRFVDAVVIIEHCIAKYLVSSYIFQNPMVFFSVSLFAPINLA